MGLSDWQERYRLRTDRRKDGGNGRTEPKRRYEFEKSTDAYNFRLPRVSNVHCSPGIFFASSRR